MNREKSIWDSPAFERARLKASLAAGREASSQLVMGTTDARTHSLDQALQRKGEVIGQLPRLDAAGHRRESDDDLAPRRLSGRAIAEFSCEWNQTSGGGAEIRCTDAASGRERWYESTAGSECRYKNLINAGQGFGADEQGEIPNGTL